MSKIIIHIEGISDHAAIGCVYQVVGSGLISGNASQKQYCYATTFANTNKKIIVTASKIGDTHTFRVRKENDQMDFAIARSDR